MKNKFRASDIERIEGHKNYYRSLKSGIIYYKDSTTPKFSTGETTITKAKRAVEKKKLDIDGKLNPRSLRQLDGITNPLLSSLWPEMLEERKSDVGQSTFNNYKKDWKHSIAPFWGNLTVQDINENNLLKYKLWYLENRPNLYARKAIVHFKMFCKWILKNKYIQVLPDFDILSSLHETVEKNARREKVGRVYHEEEIQTLLTTAQKLSKSEYLCSRAHLGILLGVRCGLRKMEAMKLKWENVDPDKKQMKVWSQKNHSWRTVPLIPEVLKAFTVQSVFTGIKSIWVFPMPSDKTKHISSQIFDKSWEAVKRKAKLNSWNEKHKARFHDLRHTFATKTAEFGWQPIVACKVLDMSLDIYQKVYCHPSDESIAKMMEKTFK